jgi:two-component sensor histidine kinase
MGDRLAIGFRREAALNRRLDLVSRELEHRIKNLIAVAQAVVNQTAKSGLDADQIREKISARLHAVGAAQSLIIRTPGCPLRLAELIDLVLEPFGRLPALRPEEASVEIPPNIATALALILHELATNASKHGALSDESGRVDLSWRDDPEDLVLTWIESGGPPVSQPAKRGFGSALFLRALDPAEGKVSTTFFPEGLECQIQLRR